jgi:hypothetical protein
MSKETMLTRRDTDVGEGSFDSIAWALNVHVKTHDTGIYHAAILHGNEDCPERIDFYTQTEPKVSDDVAYTWKPAPGADHDTNAGQTEKGKL